MPDAGEPGELHTIDPEAGDGRPNMLQNYRLRPALGEPAFSGGAAHTGAWIRTREPRLLDAPLAAALLDTWFPAPFVRLERPVGGADDRLHRPLPLAAAAAGGRRPRTPTWSPSGRISPATGSSRKTASSGRADGILLAQSRQLALLLDVS